MRLWELNIVCSVLIVLLSACRGKEVYPSVRVMGHGGNGLANPATFYHDNSLESVQCALSKPGCDGIEVDVQLSKSGTLWLFHDAVTNDELNLSGCIGTLSDAELQTAHYKTVHQEKVLRLLDLPKELLNNKTVYLDLRHMNGCDDLLADYTKIEVQLMEFFVQFSNTNVVVFCQHIPWLKALKQQNITVMTEIQHRTQYEAIILDFPALDGIVARNKNITKEEVSLIQSEQRQVILFDMRSASGSRKALKKVPNAVLTDDLTATLIERNL